MNINFSDQNCLTSITRNPLRRETRPEGQNIFGHTDVLINDIFCERQYLYVLRQYIKINSYFFKNTPLSFDMGPVSLNGS